MHRAALHILRIAAIAVVLAVSTFFAFELDRFFVPKELVLHAAALVAGLLSWRRIALTRRDRLLLAFLLLCAISAALAANRWLGLRALAVSASSIVLFWAARELRRAGLARPLLGALALAIVAIAATSLLQTYGIETTLFSENRAPGGTLGNRNFVAHAAAFGVPLLFFMAFSARTFGGFLCGAAGAGIVTATLVLTRSRAAWLAFAIVVAMTLVLLVALPALRRDGRTWRRLFAILLLIGGGVAAALLIPNELRWRDDNPYLESVRRVADYEEGSGRGRLIQYEQSLRMALRHPLFGVGPGNWAVEYPAHAARRDPSLDGSQPGMTFNPWPSSDWVAFVSERGLAAATLLALFFALLALAALRRAFRALDPDDALAAIALLGVLGGAVVTGMLDAVLLLPLPAFLVWTALGALGGEDAAGPAAGNGGGPLIMVLVLLIVLVGAARSTAQLVAMQMFESGTSLSRAARIDPGNYRLRMRLARSGKRSERCAHALAAHALYPHAEAAEAVARRCGD